MKTKIYITTLAIALIVTATTDAEELIIMPFNGDSAEIAENLGSLPDGTIMSDNRPMPQRVSPGVGGAGSAIQFSNEQTGRPNYYQSIEIPSDGMDNLKAFTITLWFKSDSSTYNTSNPIGQNLATTLLDTTAGVGGNEPGIKVGLNKGASGEQLFIYISDGVNRGQQWLSLAPRSNVRDGEWTFIAITFDGTAERRRLRYYGADEFMSIAQLDANFDFDAVTSTGDSSLNRITIGDGNRPFGNTSSHIGLIDGVYITDQVMDQEAIEAIRLASLK